MPLPHGMFHRFPVSQGGLRQRAVALSHDLAARCWVMLPDPVRPKAGTSLLAAPAVPPRMTCRLRLTYPLTGHILRPPSRRLPVECGGQRAKRSSTVPADWPFCSRAVIKPHEADLHRRFPGLRLSSDRRRRRSIPDMARPVALFRSRWADVALEELAPRPPIGATTTWS